MKAAMRRSSDFLEKPYEALCMESFSSSAWDGSTAPVSTSVERYACGRRKRQILCGLFSRSSLEIEAGSYFGGPMPQRLDIGVVANPAIRIVSTGWSTVNSFWHRKPSAHAAVGS